MGPLDEVVHGRTVPVDSSRTDIPYPCRTVLRVSWGGWCQSRHEVTNDVVVTKRTSLPNLANRVRRFIVSPLFLGPNDRRWWH